MASAVPSISVIGAARRTEDTSHPASARCSSLGRDVAVSGRKALRLEPAEHAQLRRSLQDASRRCRGDVDAVDSHDERGRRGFEDDAVRRDEDRVIGAAALGFSDRGHVHRVRQGLGTQQQPGRASGHTAVIAAIERHHADAGRPGNREVRSRGGGDPGGGRRAVIDPAAQDELDDALARSAVRRRERNGFAPLLEIRDGQVAQSRRVREPVEVRLHLLRVSVDHADGLEDAVAPLGAQLADAESGCCRVDGREGVAEVGARVVGFRRIDHEGVSPGHDSSLSTRVRGNARAEPSVTLERPGRSNPGLHLLPL